MATPGQRSLIDKVGRVYADVAWLDPEKGVDQIPRVTTTIVRRDNTEQLIVRSAEHTCLELWTALGTALDLIGQLAAT